LIINVIELSAAGRVAYRDQGAAMQCEMRCKAARVASIRSYQTYSADARSLGLDTVLPDLLGRRSLPWPRYGLTRPTRPTLAPLS